MLHMIIPSCGPWWCMYIQFHATFQLFSDHGRQIRQDQKEGWKPQKSLDSCQIIHKCCSISFTYNGFSVHLRQCCPVRFGRPQKKSKKYRLNQYSGLMMSWLISKIQPGETGESRIGSQIILPASHIASTRYVCKHYLDAHAIANRYRKFGLFITSCKYKEWAYRQAKEHTVERQIRGLKHTHILLLPHEI